MPTRVALKCRSIIAGGRGAWGEWRSGPRRQQVIAVAGQESTSPEGTQGAAGWDDAMEPADGDVATREVAQESSRGSAWVGQGCGSPVRHGRSSFGSAAGASSSGGGAPRPEGAAGSRGTDRSRREQQREAGR
jgi:hypothetical protein